MSREKYKGYIGITEKVNEKQRGQLLEEMDKTEEIFQQAQSINMKALPLKLHLQIVQCECILERLECWGFTYVDASLPSTSTDVYPPLFHM